MEAGQRAARAAASPSGHAQTGEQAEAESAQAGRTSPAHGRSGAWARATLDKGPCSPRLSRMPRSTRNHGRCRPAARAATSSAWSQVQAQEVGVAFREEGLTPEAALGEACGRRPGNAAAALPGARGSARRSRGPGRDPGRRHAGSRPGRPVRARGGERLRQCASSAATPRPRKPRRAGGLAHRKGQGEPRQDHGLARDRAHLERGKDGDDRRLCVRGALEEIEGGAMTQGARAAAWNRGRRLTQEST